MGKVKACERNCRRSLGRVIRVELLLIQSVNGNSIFMLDRGKFRKLFSIDIYAIVVLKILDAHIRRKIFTSV